MHQICLVSMLYERSRLRLICVHILIIPLEQHKVCCNIRLLCFFWVLGYLKRKKIKFCSSRTFNIFTPTHLSRFSVIRKKTLQLTQKLFSMLFNFHLMKIFPQQAGCQLIGWRVHKLNWVAIYFLFNKKNILFRCVLVVWASPGWQSVWWKSDCPDQWRLPLLAESPFHTKWSQKCCILECCSQTLIVCSAILAASCFASSLLPHWFPVWELTSGGASVIRISTSACVTFCGRLKSMSLRYTSLETFWLLDSGEHVRQPTNASLPTCPWIVRAYSLSRPSLASFASRYTKEFRLDFCRTFLQLVVYPQMFRQT